MSYVDGFVIPVPADKKEAYRKLASMAAPIFMEHGATQVVELSGPAKVSSSDVAAALG